MKGRAALIAAAMTPLQRQLAGLDTAEPDLTEVDAVEIAEDYVPTIDQADTDKPPVASYRDWRPEDTRVVTYSNEPRPGEKYADTLSQARAMAELAYGRILETNAVPGRWCFRVKKQVTHV